jgi:hypothetical protein
MVPFGGDAADDGLHQRGPPVPARLSTEHPRWAPDARALLFVTGTTRIYLLEVPSGRVRFLTHGHDPEWSPDGRLVAFIHPGPEWQLGLIQADGSGRTLLARIPLGLRGGLTWDPRGHALYVVDRAGQTLVVDVRDGKVRSAGIPLPVERLVCSPDGEWLALIAASGGDGAPGGVYLYRRRDQELIPVTPVAATTLAWAYKGRVLLALNPATGEYVRYDMATGRTQHRRASDGLIPLVPSPTADELLHDSERAPGALLLGEIGGNRLRSFAHGFLPAWSPDGEWIAFFDSEDEEGSLCTQSRNGANFTRWAGTAPDPPLRERLVNLAIWGITAVVFPGLPALAFTAATYAFLPGTGAWRLPVLLLAWVLFYILYSVGLRGARQIADSFESSLAGYLLALAPAGLLAAAAATTALSLSLYWLVPLAAVWLAVCTFGATALTCRPAGSRRALVAAWVLTLAVTSAAAALHLQRRPAADPGALTNANTTAPLTTPVRQEDR